jgi:hypothetical protein
MKPSQEVNRKTRNQGMNWIRPTTRLAIYLRDGLACVYCGDGVEDGVTLTLDHVKPHSKGGSRKPANLVTACKKCNCSRGVRSVAVFAKMVAADRGGDAREIALRVKRYTRRQPDRVRAREMIARRGTLSAVLKFRREAA